MEPTHSHPSIDAETPTMLLARTLRLLVALVLITVVIVLFLHGIAVI